MLNLQIAINIDKNVSFNINDKMSNNVKKKSKHKKLNNFEIRSNLARNI